MYPFPIKERSLKKCNVLINTTTVGSTNNKKKTIFNENEIILYNTVDDLSDKINFFKRNEKSRIKIAKNGQKKYFKLFNERKISKYIIDKSLNKKAYLF